MTAADAGGPARVTLQSCADAPIHRLGCVQPHGALLVFDTVPKLVAASANATGLLAGLGVPAVGELLGPGHLGGGALAIVQRWLASGRPKTAFQVHGDGTTFDVLAHTAEGVLLLELERRPAPPAQDATFGYLVQEVAERLQRHETTEPLLAEAVEAIRGLTGFDRVMAYRFLPDESGEVVAEARRADLEPFLGLRYPAADIPAQARQLYLHNRLRVIPDVGYAPVPILPSDQNPRTGAPFDLGGCMLRSVSPIHVEYLRNMGVGASMSISLVQGDRLWGLIACHHGGPHHPSFGVRLACLLLSEHLSLLVQRASERARAELMQRSVRARAQIVQRATAAEDLVHGVVEGWPGLLDVVAADGAAVCLGGRIATVGSVPPRETIRRLVAWLADRPGGPISVADRADAWREEVGGDVRWAGVLGAEFHRDGNGYLIWFREELLEQVRWAGDPAKRYGEGPHGPRLTPRGSFAEWRQLTRGRAAPWQEGEVEAGRLLAEELQRVALQKVSKLERIQSLLIGVLGHDLRTPLHAIRLSASLLSQSSEVGTLIERSTSRMSALIDRMLDYARLANDEGLSIVRTRQDLHAAVRGIVEETRAAFPGCEIVFSAVGEPCAAFDGTRLGQLVCNLLSNARHHGDASLPIHVRVGGDHDVVRIEVENQGPPIAAERREEVFLAFASSKPGRERTGLGLFICRAIALAHDGTIDFECAGGRTTFRVTMARWPRGAE